MDQAQHLGLATVSGNSTGRTGVSAGPSSANAFREGLESVERERKHDSFIRRPQVILYWFSVPLVFLLIQQMAQQTKAWLDSSDKR